MKTVLLLALAPMLAFARPPYPCPVTSVCAGISKVEESRDHELTCHSETTIPFSCTALAKDVGHAKLEGMRVKVTSPGFDSCHVPGICGPRACVSGFGTASLDATCL